MKHPYMQFFTGDWLKDPQLSLCSPATRGIWIDILCAIHERASGGSVQGTIRELARLCRCDSTEMDTAITELEKTGTANISRLPGDNIQVKSRRLERTQLVKQRRSEAGSKGGSIAQSKREQIPEYESEDEGISKVRAFCTSIGIGDKDADWFFWKCHGNGWKNGGNPIRDWKATLRSWQNAGYLPSQKESSHRNGSATHRKVEKAKGEYPSNVDRSKVIK